MSAVAVIKQSYNHCSGYPSPKNTTYFYETADAEHIEEAKAGKLNRTWYREGAYNPSSQINSVVAEGETECKMFWLAQKLRSQYTNLLASSWGEKHFWDRGDVLEHAERIVKGEIDGFQYEVKCWRKVEGGIACGGTNYRNTTGCSVKIDGKNMPHHL